MIDVSNMWSNSKVAEQIRRTKLTTKLTAIYMLLVLIPGILCVYIMDVNYYHILWEKYHRNAEDSYYVEVENLEARLRDIEKVSAFFMSNSNLMEYADTSENRISESLYEYMKYLKNMFQSAKSSSKYITSLTMYTKGQHSFELHGVLENLKEESIPDSILESIGGKWVIEENNEEVELNFYQPIYTTGYTNFVGVLKVGVSLMAVLDCFAEGQLCFYSEEAKLGFMKIEGEILTLHSFPVVEKSDQTAFSDVSLKMSELLNGVFMTEVTMEEDFSRSLLTVILPTLIILLLLPLIYQKAIRKQMRRIIDLSEYICESHTVNPIPYQEKEEYYDEIGTLIRVYNYNIQEINRLIREVDMAELQQKDAEFYALQAQIKPHFLYNTLENIRMTAEQEGDLKTSSMLEILGSYMRYGLKKDLKITKLMNELYHSKQYQQLMEIRFPGMIQLKIDVYTDISEITCPYLIFQPIIENAIKHGKMVEKAICIHVEIREAGSERPKDIEIRIENNGYKIENEKFQELKKQLESGISDKDGHVGLNNINFRLISCYGHGYHIRIENGKDRGVAFIFYLPVISDRTDQLSEDKRCE